MLLSFPLTFLAMLLVTGNAKLVFRGDLARAVEVETMARMQRNSQLRDSLIVENSYSFQANVEEGERLVAQQERLLREQERLNILIAELQMERQRLEAERSRFEGAISQTRDGNVRRATDLARIYQAMKPQEAAQILETLPDDLCIDILRAMTDDRQRGRILASMEIEKATRLSEMMGTRAPTRANF
jgi:flagellar motility protein MotE (MotC chaperone)